MFCHVENVNSGGAVNAPWWGAHEIDFLNMQRAHRYFSNFFFRIPDIIFHNIWAFRGFPQLFENVTLSFKEGISKIFLIKFLDSPYLKVLGKRISPEKLIGVSIYSVLKLAWS